MSINKSVIGFLEGKNVFVFDTETTGLPERVPGSKWGTASEYWSYTMNNKYNNSRIVSIAWAFIQSFDKLALDGEKIHHYIRFPEGFDSIPTTHIHGISYEYAINEGTLFNDIFENCGLYDKLIHAEYIIAHNVNFDIHILLNELFRIGTQKALEVISHIENIMALGHCICSGELGRDLCKIEYKTKSNFFNNKRNKGYKMPKLIELYKHFYGCEFDNAHNAEGDVCALLKCLIKMP
jgi:DNA polymerase III epsilon subunit-like protein